ncbi:MAG TPA: AMP-binding protein [Tepidisphaeraceae bacterium]|jgi:phenylacetate-CoA ligase
MNSRAYYNPDDEQLAPDALRHLQRCKLAEMLREIVGPNRFYTHKLADLRFDALNDSLERLPFTTRAELEADQAANPPYGSNLTYPLHEYSRFHQTSGTGGRPMRWLDTRQSWEWLKRLWGTIYTAAAVEPGHRILFPFSFGPFLGFWGAFDGATMLGNLSIPAGGMTTAARLRMLVDNRVDVVCCTPTYALHMAEVAQKEGIDLAGAPVSKLIVAGEAGGSIPEVRGRIESAWNARVYDHTGMTETGAVAFECHPSPGTGVHINEAEYLPEVIDPQTGQGVPEGEPGELVLTSLGRWASPLIRYRTNDHVRMTRRKCVCGRWFARLEGGILGRIDDMITVRGNNVFPTALEAIIRRFPEVAEFRITVSGAAALAEVQIEVEPTPDCTTAEALAERVARSIQDTLSFRAQVLTVPCGSLPRFEMKARRFIKRLN